MKINLNKNNNININNNLKNKKTMNSQVLDKIKEILGLPSEEFAPADPAMAPADAAPSDAAPSDTTTTTTEPTAVPTVEELYADVEELSLKFDDLNSRLTIIESMFMQSQANQEKLASIVEVLKNLPSGEPVSKKETSEGSFRKNKNQNVENKFYNLGKLMNNK